MNAKEKAKILQSAGYFYTTSAFAETKHRWYQGEGEALSASPWITASKTFAQATNAAYQLYMDNQVTPETSPAPQVEALVDVPQNEGYTLKIDKSFEDMAFIVAPDKRVITTGAKVATSRVAMNLLNQETAPLFDRIAALEDERDALQLSVHGLQAQLQKAERVAAAFDAELSKEQQKRIKLEADNAAYERIIIQAGKDFAALKDENVRMLEIMVMIANGSDEAQKVAHEFLTYDSTPTPPAQEAPKRPVATRCRVNWNHRGFSSGSYEVLGYSQEKQAYVLNISSDADKPMPKTVKMADCAVVS